MDLPSRLWCVMQERERSGRGHTRLFFLRTEITVILLVAENLKVCRKNCGVAVLGCSPVLDHQMLPNRCLLLKTRALHVA